MTTESRRLPRNPGSVVLVRSSLGLLGAVAVLAAVAFVVAGEDAFATVLTGGVVSALVLAFGSWAVHLVAAAMPSASLMVALMTYGLQVAALTAFMALVSDSPEWGKSLIPGWFGAFVITCVVVWVVLQVVFATRARIPVYDLPSREREAGR
jgi:ATP synthase protein I